MHLQKKHGIVTTRRRGLIAVQIAVLLVVILGFAVLSVDIGQMYNARGDMQRSVDSASLAGASNLPLGNNAAISKAVSFAGDNPVFNEQVTHSDLDVVIGHWSGSTQTFFPVEPGSTITPNAVQVQGLHNDFGLSFARIFGRSTTTVLANATAIYGGGTCTGIWGLQGVSGSGSIITDSYVSSDGAYGPNNVNANGDVCSCQDVNVSGSVEIHGDAMYGEGYNFNTSGSTYEVWGVVDTTGCNVAIPEIDFAGAEADNNNDSIGLTDLGNSPWQGNPNAYNLFLTGWDNLTLDPGVYYFTSARLTGQATLTVVGPTEIYIEHTADLMGGGLINTTQDPANLVIYALDDTVDMFGGSAFYGGVVAPNADITMHGDTEFFGVLLGQTLSFFGDAIVHVDETMVMDVMNMNPESPVLVR
ncbi:MAG: pilus assembly protein TadG-related protein [Planctomycetota bacterium]